MAEKRSLAKKIGSFLYSNRPIETAAVGTDAEGKPVAKTVTAQIPTMLGGFLRPVGAEQTRLLTLAKEPVEAQAKAAVLGQEISLRQAQVEETNALALQRNYERVTNPKNGKSVIFDYRRIGEPGYKPFEIDIDNFSPEGLQATAESYRAIIGETVWQSVPFKVGLRGAMENSKIAGSTEPLNSYLISWAGKEQTQENKTLSDVAEYTKNYQIANGLVSSTPEERKAAQDYMKAHAAYTEETKVIPGVLRIRELAQTRGIVVKDTTTGKSVPMNWADYNRKSAAEPGRYVAPQYDPDTQYDISSARASGREFSVGTEADQLASFRTFARHAATLSKFSETFANTGSPLANRTINWLRLNAANDAAVRAYLAKIDPPAKEFESFLLNNRALYQEDRETVDRILNENITPKAMAGVMQSFGQTATERLHTLNLKSIEARGRGITIDKGTADALKYLGQDLGGFNVADVENRLKSEIPTDNQTPKMSFQEASRLATERRKGKTRTLATKR